MIADTIVYVALAVWLWSKKDVLTKRYRVWRKRRRLK